MSLLDKYGKPLRSGKVTKGTKAAPKIDTDTAEPPNDNIEPPNDNIEPPNSNIEPPVKKGKK